MTQRLHQFYFRHDCFCFFLYTQQTGLVVTTDRNKPRVARQSDLLVFVVESDLLDRHQGAVGSIHSHVYFPERAHPQELPLLPLNDAVGSCLKRGVLGLLFRNRNWGGTTRRLPLDFLASLFQHAVQASRFVVKQLSVFLDQGFLAKPTVETFSVHMLAAGQNRIVFNFFVADITREVFVAFLF